MNSDVLNNPMRNYCYYPHFTDEKTEAQRGQMTCPRSSSIAEIRIQSHPRVHALNQNIGLALSCASSWGCPLATAWGSQVCWGPRENRRPLLSLVQRIPAVPPSIVLPLELQTGILRARPSPRPNATASAFVPESCESQCPSSQKGRLRLAFMAT